MTPRIHTAGNHAQPMSSARRDHIHGKLVPLDAAADEASLASVVLRLIGGALLIPLGFALLAMVGAVL